jgi:hypothetical protein
MDSLKLSYDIRHGEATNRIRATCVGDMLRLFINGQMQIEVHDSEFQSGDMGLWAGTASQVGTDILFDNLSVILPGAPANPKSISETATQTEPKVVSAICPIHK